MILRVRHEKGVLRVELPPNSTLNLLNSKVQEALGVGEVSLTADPSGQEPLRDLKKLQHGDMVFVKTRPQEVTSDVAVDLVDAVLVKESGRIPKVGNQGCRHGPGGMCASCLPYEPYDPEYLALHRIKHLSFHAYLRKLAAQSKSTYLVEEPNYQVMPDCPRHPPYPAGICTRCQPSAITLKRQEFRRIDHLEFADPRLVDDFLGEWRRRGLQRFAWLLGTYEVYQGVVPLGTKATVRALLQPPQEGSVDGFRLLPHGDDDMHLLNQLGLQIVGMIYTDLHAEGNTDRVQCRRSAGTFFVSSAEILFMARQQQLRPSRCPQAKAGWFGSKFVTCILTGDADGSIAAHAYQASEQAVAMHRADLIEACLEPHLMLVKPSTPSHYVPEVFFQERNEYGVEVQRRADPAFPVDYLLVNLSHGFPTGDAGWCFVGGAKSIAELGKLASPTLQSFANLQLLKELQSSPLVNAQEMAYLLKALATGDQSMLGAFMATSSWSNLQMASVNQGWSCPHCTFLNARSDSDTCEVCGLPRQ